MSRVGEVWEIDLLDRSFDDDERVNDIITYVVLRREGDGWHCLVLVDTRYEAAGSLMFRPERYEQWEEQSRKFRRLA